MDVKVEAGVLSDFLNSAYFTTGILNMLVEFSGKETMKVSATGVVNDRLVVCKYPATEVVEAGEWGIGDINNVIDKVSNFARGDQLRVYLDTKLNKVIVERTAKKKLYKFPFIPVNSISSKSVFSIGVGDDDDIRVKNLIKDSTSTFGKFLTSFKPNVDSFKKIMKSKDSFTDNVTLTVSPEGEVNLTTTEEDGTDALETLEILEINAPESEVISEYSFLNEVVLKLRKGSSVEMFLGNNTGILVRERAVPVGMTQFFVMPRVART